uniref:C2H2-type domain-containing protein n=1 Tax=Ananas comosus var. bracteatus TaxID=296719 RepID=A0A6V7NWM3_ANACO|nr:unnamed protein product [Ananas comosus var. bracteatus]
MHHLRKLSGCYYDQCHAVVGPFSWVSRDPSLRATVSPCPHCGEIFMKPQSLDTHQALTHAVSELGPEDTSRNIVEIIFHSSWLKKHAQPPVCRIDKVLKIHNTSKTTAKFEDYRETIKTKANKLPKMYPRCIADGNELLRIIRDGFAPDSLGRITTTASSGRADETVRRMSSYGELRAMLVCRVIAGRVKKSCEHDCQEECDSVVSSRSSVGACSNLDELLLVFNPSAILPCFVVIYSG